MEDYHRYLKSKKWKDFRLKIINERGKKCEKCGNKKYLEIHHLTYDNVFNETRNDVMVLCDLCHRKEHNIKRIKNGNFTITEKHLNSLITKQGYIPKELAVFLKIKTPIKKGWKNKIIGMKVDKKEFLKLKISIQNNNNP